MKLLLDTHILLHALTEPERLARRYRESIENPANAVFVSAISIAEIAYAHEGVGAGFQVGEYWSRLTQIDVIGLRDDDWTDLGECKWGAIRSPAALEAELERKAERYPNSRGATLGRRYFVRRMPAARRGRDGWYALDDLYALAGYGSAI